MHFSMNLIGITAVAALLLASIESAVGMMGQPISPLVPKAYLRQQMGVKGAFGQPRLELSKIIEKNDIVDYLKGKWDGKPATITCLNPNKPEGKIVQSFYERHALPSYSSLDDPQVSEGAKHFGNVVATPSPSGKQCYVIDSACKYTYEQHVANLSKKIFKKAESLQKTTNQIVAAVKYAKAKGLLYNFSSENMCFDANENLLMRRHNDVLPIEQTTSAQRIEMNRKIHTSILNLERELNGGTFTESMYRRAINRSAY
ncbi:hypothetical protein BDF22DRAFT_742223 [Syncephalis plumigaleata]|nr:hypothetical protein BDF22DRAFT_742223 [Syncephalis plumigaleata]